MITFRCNVCQQPIRVDERHAGREAKCPKCQSQLRIPSPPAQVSPAQPAATPQPQPNPFADQHAGLGSGSIAANEFPSGSAPGVSAKPVQCSACGSQMSTTADSACRNCGQVLYQNLQQQFDGRTTTPHQFQPQAHGTTFGAHQNVQKTTAQGNTGLGRSIGGLAVAAVVAGVCSVIWLIIAAVTGYEFGILAWALGGLIGLVAGAIAKNPSPIFCSLAGGLAAMSVLGVKVITALVLMLFAFGMGVVQDFGEMFDPNYLKVAHAVKDQMVEEGVFQGKEKQVAEEEVRIFFSNPVEELSVAGIDDESIWTLSESISNQVSARVKQMSDEQKEASLDRARQRFPLWIENELHYQAVLDSMVASDELADDDLVVHAKSELKMLDNEYDTEYYETVSIREQTRRRAELRKLVAQKLGTMDDLQREEAVLGAIRSHMQWIPSHDEYIAVMEKMNREKKFSGEMAEHVKKTLDETLMMEYADYSDEVDYELFAKWDSELAVLVNEQLVTMNADQRQTLIKDLKKRFPDWESEFSFGGDEMDELNDLLEEAGTDGTFWGSFKSTLSWFDILWVFLGVSTAYSVAFKQGMSK